AGDGQQRGHHANQRGLAGAVRSEQTENLTLAHTKRNIVHCGEVAVLLGNVVDHNGIAAGRRFAVGCGLRLGGKPAHRAPCSIFLGSRTSAVMPGTSAPSGLSTFSFSPMVLMSRLRRLTSRWVAKSLSTALKMTVPSIGLPAGKRTWSFWPSDTKRACVSGASARTQVSPKSMMVTIGVPGLTTSPWRVARTETVPLTGAYILV